MNDRGARLRIIAFYVSTFAVMGVYMPFWPVWLTDQGLSEREVGWIISAGIFVRVGTPWLAQRIDEIGRTRASALVLISASTLAFAAFEFVSGFAATLVVSLALGVSFMMIYPLTDNLAARTAGEHYGRLRLFGSLSFLVLNIVAGAVLEAHGSRWIYGLVLCAFIASIACATLLPEPDRATDEPVPDRPLRALLRNRPFLAFATGAGLIQSSHAGLYAFSAIHWDTLGIDDATIGAMWAISVIAEIALFQFGSRVTQWLSPLRLALVGGTAAIARWCLLVHATDTTTIFATQLLHALTFAATHLALMTYIRRNLPAQLGVTAISVYAAVGTGIGMAGATFGAGYWFEAWGAGMFWVMAAIAAGGVGLVAVSGARGLVESGRPGA